jgi:hypothetical protein
MGDERAFHREGRDHRTDEHDRRELDASPDEIGSAAYEAGQDRDARDDGTDEGTEDPGVPECAVHGTTAVTMRVLGEDRTGVN